MAMAFLAAKRSKDPTCQVGACIVNEDKIVVGIGYNGMPNGCDDDNFPWGKGSDDPLENKFLYGILNQRFINVLIFNLIVCFYSLPC